MKRTLFFVAVAVAMAFALAGCSLDLKGGESTADDQYMDCPFRKGMDIREEPFDTSDIVGTYLYKDYFSADYHFVSFLRDGRLLKTKAKVYSMDVAGEMYEGTWKVEDGRLTTSMTGMNYSSRNYETVEGKGFRILNTRVGSTSYYDVFAKETDEVMDGGLSKDPSALVGLWARSDDYGDVRGYRFMADGTVYEYSTKGQTLKSRWEMSNSRAEMKTTTLDGLWSDYYGVVVCGDSLYIGILRYTRMK